MSPALSYEDCIDRLGIARQIGLSIVGIEVPVHTLSPVDKVLKACAPHEIVYIVVEDSTKQELLLEQTAPAHWKEHLSLTDNSLAHFAKPFTRWGGSFINDKQQILSIICLPLNCT